MALIQKRDLPFLGFAAIAFGLRLVNKSSRYRYCEAASGPLGALWYWFARSSAALVRRNMRAILGPKLSAGQINALAREHFQSVTLGSLVNHALSAFTLKEYRKVLHIEGVEHIDDALAQGRGAILLGGHLGLHFYPPLAILGLMGYPITAISRENTRISDSWVYHKVIFPLRNRYHAHADLIHPTGFPQLKLVEALKKNRVLIVMGDYLDKKMLKMPVPQVTPVPFLDHTLLLQTGPFRLARWLKSPIITFFVVPRPKGHAIVIEPPLELSSDNSVEGLKADMTAFGARFQSYFSRNPALWRNWRTLRLLDLIQPELEAVPKVAQVSSNI